MFLHRIKPNAQSAVRNWILTVAKFCKFLLNTSLQLDRSNDNLPSRYWCYPCGRIHSHDSWSSRTIREPMFDKRLAQLSRIPRFICTHRCLLGPNNRTGHVDPYGKEKTSASSCSSQRTICKTPGCRNCIFCLQQGWPQWTGACFKHFWNQCSIQRYRYNCAGAGYCHALCYYWYHPWHCWLGCIHDPLDCSRFPSGKWLQIYRFGLRSYIGSLLYIVLWSHCAWHSSEWNALYFFQKTVPDGSRFLFDDPSWRCYRHRHQPDSEPLLAICHTCSGYLGFFGCRHPFVQRFCLAHLRRNQP